MNKLLTQAALRRFAACIVGGLVLAMMVGSQEGSSTSYSFAFRKSVLEPRVFVFLAIGVLLFFAITFWPTVAPYMTRPGFWPLLSGALAVVAAQALMHWYDPLGDAKFHTVAAAVAKTPTISALTSAFFGWLAWTQLIVLFLAGLTAIVLGLRWLAWVVAPLSVAAGIVAVLAHKEVVDIARSAGGVDHSLGYAAALLGFVVMAVAMVAAALTPGQVARGRAATAAILGFRPGLVPVLLGTVITVLAYTVATWFSPTNQNDTLAKTHKVLVGTVASHFTLSVLDWLAWVILVVSAVVAAAAAWFGNRVLGWLGAACGAAGTIIMLVTLYDVSDTGARTNHFDGATGPWQNLGAGGWMACGGLFLIAAGGAIAATSGWGLPRKSVLAAVRAGAPGSPRSFLAAPGAGAFAIAVAIAVALFYPPITTAFWQQVLVSEIGISMLLAVGLNVVIGWAGLLDLGFIAFYAIGSYTTAYLTNSLPVHPPSWLHLSPLAAIPFAVAVCLIAGFTLGSPTLRLRGDYLAIVTLGFGEIIRIVAVNADHVTNGSQGPLKAVPNPVIHLGPIHLKWGLAQLQYWYLLLVIFIIVVLAFRRLEHSRLGRAWAAVREDEVAAQSTGVNTTRVKLLAFAIGASTSGVAGVFFASQIGSFTPDNFVLNNSILIVAYVVFGGMGSLPGAMAGAALLTWLPEFLKDQVPSADRLMWIGAVVMLMMIFRPEGLIPARRRRTEIRAAAGQETSSAETSTLAPAGSLGGAS